MPPFLGKQPDCSIVIRIFSNIDFLGEGEGGENSEFSYIGSYIVNLKNYFLRIRFYVCIFGKEPTR